jgi:hypothetical protein
MSHWLMRTKLSDDRTPAIHQILYSLLGSILGNDIFGLRFIKRVLLISIIGAILVHLWIHYLGAPILLWLMGSSISMPKGGYFIFTVRHGMKVLVDYTIAFDYRLFPFLLMVIVTCCVADYLSLLKSWLLIQHANSKQAWKRAYLLDILLTILIGVGWTAFWILLILPLGLVFQKETLAFHILPYAMGSLLTTFVPTLLIASFLLSSAVARAMCLLGVPLDIVKTRYLNVTEKPFLSAGLLASLASIPVTSLVACVFWMIG